MFVEKSQISIIEGGGGGRGVRGGGARGGGGRGGGGRGGGGGREGTRYSKAAIYHGSDITVGYNEI